MYNSNGSNSYARAVQTNYLHVAMPTHQQLPPKDGDEVRKMAPVCKLKPHRFETAKTAGAQNVRKRMCGKHADFRTRNARKL
eukprot:356151-Rhodomonas_salina.1